jgi:translation initiation factor 2 beta subunit (eIF-2beta)/eIF-5
MPKMVLKQESRLNGVKTNIFNLDEVAKALRVPEEALIKFWCAELGASKEKTTILKGDHKPDVLQKTLDR